MSEFSTEAELSIGVSDRELQSVREQVEDALADVELGVDAGAQRGRRGGGRGGRSGRRRRRDRQRYRWARQRTSDLDDILTEVRNLSLGGGGGGGFLDDLIGVGGEAGGVLGGLLAQALGPAIGAAVGTAVGDTLSSTVLDTEPDFDTPVPVELQQDIPDLEEVVDRSVTIDVPERDPQVEVNLNPKFNPELSPSFEPTVELSPELDLFGGSGGDDIGPVPVERDPLPVERDPIPVELPDTEPGPPGGGFLPAPAPPGGGSGGDSGAIDSFKDVARTFPPFAAVEFGINKATGGEGTEIPGLGTIGADDSNSASGGRSAQQVAVNQRNTVDVGGVDIEADLSDLERELERTLRREIVPKIQELEDQVDTIDRELDAVSRELGR